MRKLQVIFTFILLQATVFSADGQQPDADAIIRDLRSKFLTVKDYEADVRIRVDVDFVKIPEKTGKVWFAQPDKIKVKIPGFALLPKRGMNFSPNQLFSEDYSVIFAREEKIGNILTYVIKVIPKNDLDDLILATVWVDPARNIIRKMESSSRTEGTFIMNFLYPEKASAFDLPSEIRFDFDLRKTELPLGLTGDFENTGTRQKGSKTSRGTVHVKYLAYLINQGKGITATSGKKK